MDVYALGDVSEVIGETAAIGRRTWPIVGSVGVTGGPVNVNVVGTVGENFINVRWCSVGIATCVADPSERWYMRWVES